MPIVGPYDLVPWARQALFEGRPLAPVREARDYIVALVTFVAGLGAGALVALQTHRQRAHGWAGLPGRQPRERRGRVRR